MSNNNNIQDFDNFFRESFSGFEPPAPQGVWESLQTQLGNASGASGAGTTALTKAGLWGAGKIILGTVAAIAVATTVYLVVNTTDKKDQPKDGIEASTLSGNSTTNPTQPEVIANTTPDKEASTGVNAPQSSDLAISQPDGFVPSTDKTGASPTTQTSTPILDGQPAQQQQPNPASTPGTKGGVDTKTDKQTVGLYLSAQRVCAGEKLTVTIADDLSKNTYRVNFGDGTTTLTQLGKITTHTYKVGGNYTVNATDLSGNKITPATNVEVSEVKASFSAKNLQAAIFTFTNTSKGATQYQWYFGDDGEMARETSPVHSYRSFEAKDYRVKLLAINAIGCIDSFVTTVKQTYTYEDLKPKVYNVFSPNGDGSNDQFVVDIRNEESFHIVIYNKGGDKVFESADANDSWDGRNKYTGQDCEEATYRYVLVYKIQGFGEHVRKGTVDIKRK